LSPFDAALHALDGQVYSQLPGEAQRRVRRFPLTVVTLTNYGPEEPYELFFRLNQHMALTPPEKRNALYGEARDQVKSIVDRFATSGLLRKETIGFANSRLAYDDVIARVALALEAGTLRAPFSNRAIEDFYRERSFSPHVIDRVATTAEQFLIRADEVRPKLNKATLFSWLIFTHTLDGMGEVLPAAFLGEFEHARRRAKISIRDLPTELQPIVRTFNDRASYRVNDTLSVLLRDLALHAAHALVVPNQDRRGLASRLRPFLDGSAEDGEQALVRVLEETQWDLPQ
jgi:hypothetical protein